MADGIFGNCLPGIAEMAHGEITVDVEGDGCQLYAPRTHVERSFLGEKHFLHKTAL